MKKMHLVSLVLCLCFVLSGPVTGQQVQPDIAAQKSCKLCGMDRGNFDFSRMLIEYEDGTSSAVCSLHCAAVDLANNIDKTPKTIKVGEFDSARLIDAEKAVWAVGGKKPGVMSRRGKWAFETKENAENFIKSNQ